MADENIQLLAHLMRRAGFGATRDELAECAQDGYEATVTRLLDTSNPVSMSEYLIRRFHPDESSMLLGNSGIDAWLYRMTTTNAPLLEKMGLFWHGIFATGYAKVINSKPLSDQIRMFKRYGMGSFRTLLLELSKDPAMIIWLDNQTNHKEAINENFGRELLELFSMGVGNYTEDDVKQCARAFTGWTIGNREYMELRSNRDSDWPYGRISWHFEYRPEDHDDDEKEFLGQTGKFNGEDIVDIICRQPATARFISRHLYHHFVADEPPVPQWPYEPPRDPEAIETLSQAYFDSNYDIRSMLQVLFNSDFFKSQSCWHEKIKSPADLVTGVLRLTEAFDRPRYETIGKRMRMEFMGQKLSNPPSVEGWDGGLAWIDTGALVERMNFASEELGDTTTPGSQALIRRLVADNGGTVTPERLVDICLDHLGALSVHEETRSMLVDYAAESGDIHVGEAGLGENARQSVAGVVQLIAATPEFQRA
jgi:uncharacterized protein (DUF1800 family)